MKQPSAHLLSHFVAPEGTLRQELWPPVEYCLVFCEDAAVNHL